jgi:Ni/Co efflux regulator RcnB
MLLIAGRGICARIPLWITVSQQYLLITETTGNFKEFLET